MSKVAIRVEGLSKRYRIGPPQRYQTLRDSLANAVRAPFKAVATLRDGERRIEPRHPHIWALKDVSFDVSQGEVLGIIGPNGAGKSTLLKILSRITDPTHGRIQIRGRLGSLLEVGTGFHPEMTGRENVYLNGAILGMGKKEIDQKFDEIVAFAEVERFMDTPVKHYSSGMYVRLAFAVAAHLEPDILLVDEVLAVGDVAFQKKCLGRMGDVARGGRTVLFVSHNLGAVEALCDRALLLSDGRLVSCGETREIIADYLSWGGREAAVVDSREHSGRRPGMSAVVVGLRVLNEAGEETTRFNVGEDVIFELALDPQGKTFQSSSVSIAIFSQVGQLLCKLATWAQARDTWTVNTATTMRCIWHDCRLSPGEYHLDVGFGNLGQAVDYVERLARIEVVELGASESGKVPSGLFVPRVDWLMFAADPVKDPPVSAQGEERKG